MKNMKKIFLLAGVFCLQMYAFAQSPEIEMVAVRGGSFMMGCTNEQGNDCRYFESPAHQVKLSDFSIGKYEVTQAQWESVMGRNPATYKGGSNFPIESINWNDVQTFITALNTKTGKNYRLPTEAEWEYAARGGLLSKGYKYSGSNIINDVAWYSGNAGKTTHAVGTKEPNELGIYDMNGNVWEWCNDWHEDYSAAEQFNPAGPSSGTSRILRGGSWYHIAQYCRVASRTYYEPDYTSTNLGFRLVLP
jgi:formylglycine-generating enzyme required for sulfatase activity